MSDSTKRKKPQNQKSSGKSVTKKPRNAKANGQKSPAKLEQRQNAGSATRKSRKRIRKNRKSFTLFGFVKRLAYWGMVISIWCLVLFIGVLGYHAAYLPPTSEWSIPKRPPNVQIVSVEGEVIGNRGETGGKPVTLDEIPPFLPQAVMAIEDRRFYYHPGVDPIGLTRALISNLIEGRVVQGGSTLTQQIAKNLFLEPDRTISRKMQELVLSFWLEVSLTKDEIMSLYLNRVYLGGGAYGIDAASHRYFRKSAREINLSEAAMLAGLLKAPSKFSPSRNLKVAQDRAALVLHAMNDEGYITDGELEFALNNPAKIISKHFVGSFNYAADWVMERLPGYIGSIEEDVRVETTIDKDLQYFAEQSLLETISREGRKFQVSQGAVVSINTSGAVRVLIGGKNYAQSQFNRAVLAKRQPGSTFKPFVYLAAVERGFKPDTIRNDRPISIDGWTPSNYTGEYLGQVSLTQALANSINTVAAELVYEIGPESVSQTAQRLGIYTPLVSTPSIALGTSEVTPLELTTAFVPFSNGGFGVVPYVIKRITTESGKVLYERKGSGPGRIIDLKHVGMMNFMMSETIQSGTGEKAQLANWPAAGKSGTSQSFRDAWFIGYTSELTTGVWLGNDNNKPTKELTGGTLPAVIWKSYMERAHRGLKVSNLPGNYVPVDLSTQSSPESESESDSAIGNFFRNLFGG